MAIKKELYSCEIKNCLEPINKELKYCKKHCIEHTETHFSKIQISWKIWMMENILGREYILINCFYCDGAIDKYQFEKWEHKINNQQIILSMDKENKNDNDRKL